MFNRKIINIKSVAKKIIPEESFVKIGKIKSREERDFLYKYLIRSNLELKMHSLEKEIKFLGKEEDVFNLEIKTKLLNSKIRYFIITYDKRDLRVVLKLFKEIEKEISELR